MGTILFLPFPLFEPSHSYLGTKCTIASVASQKQKTGTEAEGMKVRYEEELPTMMVYVVRGDNAMGNLLRHRKPPAPPELGLGLSAGLR